MNRLIKIACLIVILVTAFIIPQNNKINPTTTNSVTSSYSYLNLNNISTVFRNNGISDIDTSENYAGFVFPKGTRKTAVFISGLIWGAKISGDPQARIGGSTYATGLQGGKILSTGEPENPEAEHVRIYRVRADVFPGGPPVDLSIEVLVEGKSDAEIRTQYESDWIEWRATDGAPFNDIDNDGIYDPSIDIPGIPGASQTIWFVANDLNVGLTLDAFYSLPLGIECQATYWEYKTGTSLDNIIFRKYVLINKTDVIDFPETFNDMYISLWSDPDIGRSNDDFVGCDTLLNLIYGYNAYEYDEIYDPLPPPAVGFSLLNGPATQYTSSQPITATYYFSRGSGGYDPPYDPSQYYNFLQGKIGLTGEFWINPVTLEPTTYPLSGNPITGDGWVDGISIIPGDRVVGFASGPFQMEPADTQVIIISEIAALGTDRLNSIKVLKYYNYLANELNNNEFYLPPAPTSPTMIVDDSDRIIELNWGTDNSEIDGIENFSEDGYTFQGYNLYQFPYPLSPKDNAVRIATYDLKDGIKEIPGIVMDPETGLPINGIVQQGSDSGVRRSFSTSYDYIENEKMTVGKKYYFAVTAYAYNPIPENNKYSSESIIQIIEAEYFEALPGAKYGDDIQVFHSAGDGNGDVFVKVHNPIQLRGNDYKVTFHNQAQIRNENGDWVAGSEVIRKFNPEDPDTLTGTTIDCAAVYGQSAEEIELQFYLDIISPNFSWVDGVSLTFPEGLEIIDIPPIFVSGSESNEPEPVEILGNVVRIGITDNSQSQYGHFQGGGEEWSIIVADNSFSLPLSIDWIAHDDGWGGGLNEAGTTIVNTIGYVSRQAHLWNLVNTTTSELALLDYSIYDRIDRFPQRDDAPTMVENPIVDGYQITVDGTFDPPIEFTSLELNSPSGLTILSSNSSTQTLDIQNYTIFGVISSMAIDNFNVGTDDPNMLEQDYKLRFTGVYDSMFVGDQRVYYVKNGGQMATVFRMATGSNLANHPLNPNPGVAEPFLLRIPFEVWNVEDPENEFQVNLTFRDRVRYGAEDPFWAWNPTDRMYSIIVNSPYDSTQVIQIDDGPDDFNASATWVLVHYGTNYHLGDVVRIYFRGPVQFGVDEFTFATPVPVDTTTRVIPITDYKLFQNYPNPFNPETTIRFEIPESGIVTLDIYDILGQRVIRLLNRELTSDSYEVTFNGSHLASGVYFYTLSIKDKFFDAKKMLFIK